MKLFTKLLFIISTSIVLMACSIGNGRICGPQTPKAYCDREVYDDLMHPKPYLQKWEKAGAVPERRRDDSASCGGGTDDSPGFSHRTKSSQLPNEDEGKTYSRLFREWQRCMIKNGYRYTGECYNNERSKALPACGAP